MIEVIKSLLLMHKVNQRVMYVKIKTLAYTQESIKAGVTTCPYIQHVICTTSQLTDDRVLTYHTLHSLSEPLGIKRNS